MKRVLLAVLTALIAVLIVLILVVAVSPIASADHNTNHCAGDVTDTTGDPLSVAVAAPDGFLIDGYCVKSGSANQGDGPVYVEIDPPVAGVTITYPGGKSVSHYSVSLVPVTTTSTSTSTTSTSTSTTSSTTTTVGSTTSTTAVGVATSTTRVDPVTTTTLGPVAGASQEVLPFTGFDPLLWVLVALMLLMVGALLAMVRDR